ncbi:hypothetical protein RMCBS344292_14236 [Rhizopus microsporus]|nr:hypothetical protein RMCBS344292_14236 [Rhizopus microsporus]
MKPGREAQSLPLIHLLDEKPSEKIILDIQDTKRYFESQSGGVDQVKMTEDQINFRKQESCSVDIKESLNTGSLIYQNK